jgi:hypothetical protein
MEKTLIEIHEIKTQGAKQFTVLEKRIPAVIYKMKKLVKPEGGEREISCSIMAQIYHSEKISGNQRIVIKSQEYYVADIHFSGLLNITTLYLSEVEK